MKIELDIRKSLEENAEAYFLAARKARSKIEGARKAIELAKKNKESAPSEVVVNKPKPLRKKDWFEKFKWFFTSNGLLVIAGRDATTNEIVIKKHAEPGDLVFHTDAPGSPFVVLKASGKAVPDDVKLEVADFCVAHSKAWKLGIGGLEVFCVKPEQVSKKTKAGEFMGKGSFMIYGEREYFKDTRMRLAASLRDDKLMVSPERTLINSGVKNYLLITPGDRKTSDVAKFIAKFFSFDDIDSVVASLPSGGCSVVIVNDGAGKNNS